MRLSLPACMCVHLQKVHMHVCSCFSISIKIKHTIIHSINNKISHSTNNQAISGSRTHLWITWQYTYGSRKYYPQTITWRNPCFFCTSNSLAAKIHSTTKSTVAIHTLKSLNDRFKYVTVPISGSMSGSWDIKFAWK